MFHRTIYIQYKPGVTQAEASELMRAFQSLPRQTEGLVSVSVNLAETLYDASIDLCFATEQARRACDFSDACRAVLARARELSENLESRESVDEQGVAYDAYGAALPMKWHKFLIYFALWAGAILNGLSGLQTLFGCFGGELAPIYDAYPVLLALDLFSGLCLVGIAVFQFITRNALARLSRKAPQMVVWLYASTVILSVLQVVAVWLVSGVGLSYVMTPDMWLILIEGALMTWANQVYYRKRAAMFVN